MAKPGYKECPFCAEEIREKAIKCRFCQSMLTDAPAPPVAPTSPSGASAEDLVPTGALTDDPRWERLRRYLPAKVAESIIAGTDITDEGERKQITVLFADLTSFSTMSEDMDPEAVKLLMDGCFQVLVECIERYGGTVDKYLGDAVMALFGAPQAHEDDPERAIRAAADMLIAVREYGKSRGIALNLSFGISTGEVVVGGLGGDRHVQYTAIGDRVNLAARLEGVAQAGQIIISDTTYQFVKSAFPCKLLGLLQLKGLRKAVEAYEVLEVGIVSSHEGRLFRMELSPLIGREQTLSDFRKWTETAFAGSGQVIHLIAEAGVGKSRLFMEMRKGLPLAAGRAIVARSLSFGRSFPYHPLADCLRKLCLITDTATPEQARESVHRATAGRVRDAAMTEEVAAHLIGLEPLPGGKLLQYPPRDRQEIIFETMVDLIRAIAGNEPMLLAFEDLHWADAQTLEFLDFALPRLAGAPMAIVLIYRPSIARRWKMDMAHHYVALEELSREESERLLYALLGVPELPDETWKDILVKSEGNPFYVEELVRALRDQGIIRERDGRHEVVGDLASFAVPDTLQALILARIDALSVQVKRILQCASVIGMEFRYVLLETLLGVREQVKHYLTELSGLELIYEKTILPELEYLFRHILTQEVTYRTLLTKRRREYHGRIAICLEEIYADHLHEHYELLAHHFSHSDELNKAIDYCGKAADKCRVLFANEAAVDFYTRRLELMPDPQTGNEKRECARTLISRGDVLSLTGQTDKARTDYQAALPLVEQLNDLRLRGDVALALGDLTRTLGDYAHAQEHLLSALEDYGRASHAAGVYAARRGLGVVHWNRGEYAAALERFEEILAGDDRPAGLWDAAQDYNNLGLVKWNLGDYAGAVAALTRSVELREELGDRKGLAAGLNNLGIAHERRGDYAAARAAYVRALLESGEIEYALGQSAARANLGQLDVHQGRYEEAQEHYAEALTLLQAARDAHGEAMVMGNIGQVWCALARPDEAESWLNRARELAEQTGDHDSWMNAERGLAELELSRGRPEVARERLDKAIRLAVERSHDDSAVPLRRLLARACRETGEADRASQAAHLALDGARQKHYRAEEMWALFEIAQLGDPAGRDASDEMREALAIAHELDAQPLLAAAR